MKTGYVTEKEKITNSDGSTTWLVWYADQDGAELGCEEYASEEEIEEDKLFFESDFDADPMDYRVVNGKIVPKDEV